MFIHLIDLVLVEAMTFSVGRNKNMDPRMRKVNQAINQPSQRHEHTASSRNTYLTHLTFKNNRAYSGRILPSLFLCMPKNVRQTSININTTLNWS